MIERKPRKAFLYSGLLTLIFAFLCKWTAMPAYSFWGLFCISISLKTLYLISVFRTKAKLNAGFYFILAGIGIILIFMFFKYIYPIRLLNKILLYVAISLKVTGLILMIFTGKQSEKQR